MATQLSEHFTLEELTITSNPKYQEVNRVLTAGQTQKLSILAQHCEKIREICGNSPVRIHSGYRCLALNSGTKGSSQTSQHPRCEAVDFDVEGQTLEDTFNNLIAAARAGQFKYGQVILEEAWRDYGVARWVHCSVIGTLPPDKVGQILKMKANEDEAPQYVLIDTVKFS